MAHILALTFQFHDGKTINNSIEYTSLENTRFAFRPIEFQTVR